MPKSVSIRKFMNAIERLEPGPVIENASVWYSTQQEHWLGWCRGYHTPGAYNRKYPGGDARTVYTRIVNWQMLDWLIEAAGIDAATVAAARREAKGHPTMQGKAGAIRRHVPWEAMQAALWPG